LTLSTVKPFCSSATVIGVATETFLLPDSPSALILMFASISPVLATVKVRVVIPEPKSKDVAPKRLVPVIVTSRVWP